MLTAKVRVMEIIGFQGRKGFLFFFLFYDISYAPFKTFTPQAVPNAGWGDRLNTY